MKRYEIYKPSGIEWLGEIPEHWEVKRIKNICDYISRGITPTYVEESPFKAINQGTFSKGFFDYENAKFTTKSDKRALAKKEDILLASTGGGVLGKTFYIEDINGYFFADSHVTTLRVNKKQLISKYLYYFFSINYDLINGVLAKGSTNQTELQRDQLMNFHWCTPTITEQTSITNFLNTKTAAIDRKLELLTAKIDKYKALRRSLINETVCRGLNPNALLKDSGIEWIGMIPEHWEVKRVKDHLDLLTGNSISDKTDYEDSNNSIPYVATKDIEINSCNIDYENGIYIPRKELKNFKTINPNSILLCIEGGSAGKKIAFNTRRICFVNKLCSFSSKGNAVDIKYNFYQMQSAPWLFQFNQVLNGLIGGVSISLLKTFRLITPPRNEQAEIAIYLDNKTTQIDTILTNISEQIGKLTQLRKTLINDVVTGKIKVTD